jgi:DNA-binding LacI/PurR family transcriptional regulator
MISKVQTIKDKILRELNSGVYQADRPLPSRHQYMRRFKCSRMTVDRAIGELVKDGFLESRRGSGTYPTSGRARDGGLTQVMLIGAFDSHEVDRSIAGIACRIATSIQDHIPCHIYNLSDAAVHLNRFMRQGTAVIWQRPSYAELLLMDNLRHAGIRQILLGRCYRDYDYVTTDTKNSIREGLEWLTGHGGHRISCLFEDYDPDFQYIGERQVAFYELAVELKLKLNAEFIRKVPRLSGIALTSHIEEAADKLFAPNAPDLIFVSYSMALEPLISAAVRRGKTPGKDFHVVCFDYESRVAGTPGVAMLRQRWEKIEQIAFEWVFNPANSDRFTVEVPTELIIPQ